MDPVQSNEDGEGVEILVSPNRNRSFLTSGGNCSIIVHQHARVESIEVLVALKVMFTIANVISLEVIFLALMRLVSNG